MKDKMSNSEDKNQQPQVGMSLKQWLQVIEENREKVSAHVMMIAEEKGVDEEEDLETQMLEIMLANPVVAYLMRVVEEDFGMWNVSLVISKSLLASFFDMTPEVMQIFGVIQEFEAQSAQVMDSWINYHLNREQLKAGVLSNMVDPDLLFNSDFYAAFMLLDKKMISEIKSDLTDLLNNYSILIDVFGAATAHMNDDEEEDFCFDTMYM